MISEETLNAIVDEVIERVDDYEEDFSIAIQDTIEEFGLEVTDELYKLIYEMCI